MRRRDKSIDQQETIEAWTKAYASSTWVPQSSPGTLAWTNRDLMDDVSTPGFRRASAQGSIIISPMFRWVSTGKFLSLGDFITYGRPDSQGRRSGSKWESLFAPAYPPSTLMTFQPDDTVWNQNAKIEDWISKVEGLAVTKAYAAVGQPEMSALVSLAEIPETLALLFSPVKAMIKLTRRAERWRAYYMSTMARYKSRMEKWKSLPARQRAKRGPPKAPKIRPFTVGNFSAVDISGMWLAYRYGIMPLIYDFESLTKALEKVSQPPRMTARAKEVQSSTDDVHVYDTTRGDTVVGRYTSRITHTLHLKVESRAGVLYVPEELNVGSKYGLKPERIPAAAYELIPFSFVADWFWNGAEYYDALMAECRVQSILGAWVTSKVNYEFTVRREVISVDSGTTVIGDDGVFFREEGNVTRRRKVTLADVHIYGRIALNAKRIADGLALIHTFVAQRK